MELPDTRVTTASLCLPIKLIYAPILSSDAACNGVASMVEDTMDRNVDCSNFNPGNNMMVVVMIKCVAGERV